ncbi:MAG: hypothetical protein FJY77_04900 [Candidatus Altiarchaeales archaeon]|nr:hypothetical protein [Candidatus Altiarchaeales archaeon]
MIEELSNRKGLQEAGKLQEGMPKPIQKVEVKVGLQGDYRKVHLVELEIREVIKAPLFQKVLAEQIGGVQQILVVKRQESKCLKP